MNTHHPLPLEIKGKYCQIIDQGKTRFFEIDFVPYDSLKIEKLKKAGVFEDSTLGQYVALLKDPILKGKGFIYKLQTYFADESLNHDIWLFNESILDYQQFCWLSIDELLYSCKEKWGIKKNQFVPITETSLPR